MRRTRDWVFGMLAACLLAGCDGADPPRRDAPPQAPDAAVARLVADLQRDDLAGYARHALPPALHARVDAAWRAGRTRWPLVELPLHDRIPGAIQALAADGASARLTRQFDRQFAGETRELQAAAATLGLFAAQSVRTEGDFGEAERDHYAELVAAFGRWGRSAPLGDRARGHRTIARLVRATRAAGLGDAARWQAEGLDAGLTRLRPLVRATRLSLRDYGMDVQAALAAARIDTLEHAGARATVRVRYALAGQPIEARVPVQRIDGAWYLDDVLRVAEREAGPVAPAPVAAPAVAPTLPPAGRGPAATPAPAPR